MSDYPRSPRVTKGAIVGMDAYNPLASVIIFQYNPETLTRTLQPQVGGGEESSTPTRLKGPPSESIRLEVSIDATDQLERGSDLALAMGIYPQLSALEMLLYPKSRLVIANTLLQAAGTLEIVPMEAPLALFVWGPARVLPVRLTEFSITEEDHDPSLNPIRAKVSLGMRVLNYSDFSPTHPGFALFMTHQVMKETMAVIGSVGNVANLPNIL